MCLIGTFYDNPNIIWHPLFDEELFLYIPAKHRFAERTSIILSEVSGLRSLVGGEIHEYTALLEGTRKKTVDRLVKNAQVMGANAVVMMRFDSSEIGQTVSEIWDEMWPTGGRINFGILDIEDDRIIYLRDITQIIDSYESAIQYVKNELSSYGRNIGDLKSHKD